jgi:folate-binding Fe-S cluster repair protein YgfZ
MEINETTVLDDRGFIQINGNEAKSFLQNIVTNDIEKITDSFYSPG